jgi:hypothetical protein
MLTILGCECPAVCVDILANIIILGKVEEPPDLGGPLGSPHSGLLSVSKPRQIIFSLLDNHQVDNRQVMADNATTDRFPATLTITPAIPTEARSACRVKQPVKKISRGGNEQFELYHGNKRLTPVEHKADTPRGQHSLLHWETLFVTATHDLEDIALEFLQKHGSQYANTLEQ